MPRWSYKNTVNNIQANISPLEATTAGPEYFNIVKAQEKDLNNFMKMIEVLKD